MKNKGFSFIELLVAVAILGIISLPIVSSFALAAKTDAKAVHLSAMNDAADDVLMLLEEMDVVFSDDGNFETAFLASFKQYSDSDLISNLPEHFSESSLEFSYNNYSVKLQSKVLVENYYRVDITVTHLVSGATLEVNRRGLLKYA